MSYNIVIEIMRRAKKKFIIVKTDGETCQLLLNTERGLTSSLLQDYVIIPPLMHHYMTEL